jgi:serine/threonine protein kinase
MTLKNVHHRFKVDYKLGSGAFGEIYAGHELYTDVPVAIKLEQTNARHPQLRYEARIYHTLQHELQGFIPRMYYFGNEKSYNVLVLQRLGKNFEQLRSESPTQRLSYSVVAEVAVAVLTILELFHDLGFVHRDLKPDNILTGLDGKGVYLIDFGLSKMIFDSVTGKHISDRAGKHLIGTPRYASIGNHRGHEQGRKDDLESLGYVLLYLLRGFLPWQSITEDYDSIMREKQSKIQDLSLFIDTPTAFRRFFRYINTLHFGDRPDYDYLRRLFTK